MSREIRQWSRRGERGDNHFVGTSWPKRNILRRARSAREEPQRDVTLRARYTGTVLGALAVLVPGGAAAAEATDLGQSLPLSAVIPFAGLLLSIAVCPLAFPRWWERNLHKAIVSLLFGVPVAILVGLLAPIVVLHELIEYASFITLLGSLFVVSGGLLLRGDLQATPLTNAALLGVGAVLASVIGTTGASMVLIRPVLRTNSERKNTRHIPVFFIFLVSNIGGLLTPLGDPPLFLGFLRGVPFFWTLRLAPIWAMAVLSVLVIFYLWDRREYGREDPEDLRRDRVEQEPLGLVGTLNVLWLAGIVGAVFLPAPWREGMMLLMAALSLALTPRDVRRENGFTFGPIIEVAVLFLGIFLAMIPALAILQARGHSLGITQPWQFFWTTGALSSFLDNAPTYLTFLSLAQGLSLPADVVGVPGILLQAISAGAVFMGANSYIGNGPNFMVKAIADEAKVKTPDFFSYMVIAAMVLGPVYVVVTLVFFR
jgi:Na+/H+ antiporter NhaD/arsenite permease-like protein